MSPTTIRVSLRRIDRDPIKAFADVTIESAMGDITVLGFRVVQQPGKSPWIGFPNTSYVKDGKTVNKDLLELTRSQRDLIANAVLAEYRRPSEPASVAAARKTA